MNTFNFNFDSFFIDNRISASELSEKMDINYSSVWAMVKRKSIKMAFLRQLESLFGDCSKYIIQDTQVISDSKVNAAN